MMIAHAERGVSLTRPHPGCGVSTLEPASLSLISIKDLLPMPAKQEGDMAADGRHTRMSVGSHCSGMVGRE